MCKILNLLIQSVADAGLSGTVYTGFHILTFVGVFILAVWYGKKLKMSAIQSIATVVIVYPLADFWKRVLYWIESGFQTFGGENNVRLFIYVPLISFIVCKLFRIKWKKMCDFLAPCMVLTQGIGHFGCIFPGCCAGYPSSWGLYNIREQQILFPIQLLEAITAILITVFLVYRSKKREYAVDGLQYPIMLLQFGLTRFIWEFFRNNEKVWMGCSSLAFHALFAFVIGVVAYIIVKRKNEEKIQTNSLEISKEAHHESGTM